MNGSSATPVEQLREQAKRLEAALSVGMATPTAKAVHELRSSTRRVQAQLELLEKVSGLPRWKPDAKKVLRRLATLRRKAGKVRDCDVQAKLLEDEDHQVTAAAEAPQDLAASMERLRARLQKDRDRSERKLLAEIERQLPKLTRNTENLLKTLKPAKEVEVPVSHLLASIEQQMERLLRSRERGEDHLHELRKSAKRARYQCESLPGPQAAAAARRLEELQDAGGSWHDLLDLATSCHKRFGPEHPLSRVLEHLRDEKLDHYLANLDDFRARHTQSSNGTRSAAKAAARHSAPAKGKPRSKAATSSQRKRA
jgi:CHAD domain-containing protein